MSLKKKFKKFRLLMIVLVLIFVFGFFLYRRGKLNQRPTDAGRSVAQTGYVVPRSQDFGNTTSVSRVDIEINTADLFFPDSLPVYRMLQSPWGVNEAIEISRSLGFETSPSEIGLPNNKTTYVSFDESGYLQISPSERIIDFKRDVVSNSSNFSLTEEEIVGRAQDLMVSGRFLSSQNLVFSEVKYVTGSVEHYTNSIRSDADLAIVSFVIDIYSYPLITTTPIRGTASVGINRDGVMVFVYLDSIPEIEVVSEQKILSFEELPEKVQEARIVSLDNGNIESDFISNSFIEQISIEEVYLAYLQEDDSNNESLLPVFVLDGTAVIIDDSEVQIQLYLPAIRGNFSR